MGFAELIIGVAVAMFLADLGLIPKPELGFLHYLDWIAPVWLIILAGAFRSLFFFLNSVVSSFSYEVFCFEMRNFFSDASLREGTLSFSTAKLSNLFSTVISRSGALLAALSQLFSSSIVFLFLLFSLFSLSFELSLASLIFLAIFSLPLLGLRGIYQKYSAKVYAGTSRFTQKLIRASKNKEFLLIVGKNLEESRELNASSNDILTNCLKYVLGLSANGAWPQFAGILVFVAVALANQSFSFVPNSILIPFVYLLLRLGTTVSTCATAMGNAQFAFRFLEELEDERAKVSQSSNEINSGIPIGAIESIEVRGLVVGRDTPFTQPIYLQLNPGDFLLISGPSGKGKSTLLMSLIGLVPPLLGEVFWNGKRFNSWDPLMLRQKVAFSGADPFLLDGSLRENLCYGAFGDGAKVPDEMILEALKSAECDFAYSLGLNYLLGEGGEGLSAGQKQRLSLARALLRQPQVLILDEATANLDLEVEAKILENIRKLLPNSIILAVSHRDSMRKFATKFLEV